MHQECGVQNNILPGIAAGGDWRAAALGLRRPAASWTSLCGGGGWGRSSQRRRVRADAGRGGWMAASQSRLLAGYQGLLFLFLVKVSRVHFCPVNPSSSCFLCSTSSRSKRNSNRGKEGHRRSKQYWIEGGRSLRRARIQSWRGRQRQTDGRCLGRGRPRWSRGKSERRPVPPTRSATAIARQFGAMAWA